MESHPETTAEPTEMKNSLRIHVGGWIPARYREFFEGILMSPYEFVQFFDSRGMEVRGGTMRRKVETLEIREIGVGRREHERYSQTP